MASVLQRAARPALPLAARLLIALLPFCLASWLAWASLRAGTARFVASRAVVARSGTDLAARLAPSDPEAHFATAWLLSNVGDWAGAEAAYGRALGLRPADYLLWLELGKVREARGDAEGALAAMKRAVELAPHYAQPRWQFGNALLRAGRSNEALAELGRAAQADPALYPNLLQSLWYTSGRDPRAFADAARPANAAQALEVARLLTKAGAADEGVRVLRESGGALSEEARRVLVHDLIAAGAIADAYDFWAEGRGRGAQRGAVYDGGFEGEQNADGGGFGWRFARDAAALKLSPDADSPREGSRSLKVEYTGNSNPSSRAVSQLVPVEPRVRYRLVFSARTRDLVTGGLPFVQVVPAGKSDEPLGSSAALPPGTSEWQDVTVEFMTPQDARAVRVELRRRPCSSSPCPAFGAVWLDAFVLKRL